MTDLSITPNSNPNNWRTFNFMGHDVRATTDTDGKPFFVATDICMALDLGNVSKAVANIPNSDKRITIGYTSTGEKSLLIVTEFGLNRLIFRSNKPEAEKFQRWILGEVLPALREKGFYASRELTPLDVLDQMVSTLRTQQAAIDATNRRVDHTANRVEHIETNLTLSEQYFTIVGYYLYRGLEAPPKKEAQELGRLASALSRQYKLSMGKVPHAEYGTIKTYHISVLDELIG